MKSDEFSDFLPAALAIEAKPPSPVGRAVMWIIVLLCVVAVGWAMVGRLDIVTVAAGRIIPAGHSRPVQAPRIGQLESVRVKEGEYVNEGDVLIILDVEHAEADLARTDAEIRSVETDILRYRRVLAWLTDDRVGPPVEDTGTGDGTARGWWHAYEDQQAVLRHERDQQVAEKRNTEQQLAKLQAILPLVEEIAEDEQRLAEQKLLAAHRALQTEQRRLEVLHDLRMAQNRIVEQDQALAAIDARAKLLRSEHEREWRDTLEVNVRRLEGLQQQRVKAREQLQRSRVRAPVSGRVQQLAVHGSGAVVSAGQTLLNIVPQDAGLEVQAELANRDVGFVEVGQAVVIKVDTFPFTRYGAIPGRVSGLSADAMSAGGEPSLYGLRASLDRTYIEQNGRRIPLMAGMNVTVEAQTGSRRLITYFLDPLMRGLDESVRER
jgi:hemolysin D